MKNQINEELRKKVISFIAFKFKSNRFSNEIIDDLTQDILIKIHLNTHRYDASKYLFVTWYLTIAKNHVIDYLRANKKYKSNVSISDSFDSDDNDFSLLNLLISDSKTPEQQASSNERIAFLHKAIDKLPDRQREIVRYKLEGFKLREISELLQIPIGTIKGYNFKAENTLKDNLINVL